MKTVGNSERIFRYLLNLNSWIVMVLGGVIAKSIRGYIREQSAHEFLKSVTAVPVTPWKTCVLLVLLFFFVWYFYFRYGRRAMAFSIAVPDWNF